MNPILPLAYHVPDVEAKVYKDGYVYLYGSYDLTGNPEYCSKDYYVFFSKDFKTFEKSELAFSNRNGEIPWSDGDLYAPDCIEKDGMYHLYFCTSDGSEGVAESRNPLGPFINPVEILGVNRTGIDPTVFIDDDGQIYYFWGQFELRGAKLNSDMHSLDLNSFQNSILSEKEHGFHEGASICKRNGKYYLVYTDISRGRATCLSYAISDFPLGPYVKGGVIIDNTGCDPKSWNNHGCICEIKGQWYVFYHRSTHNSFYSRRVCVEKIYFDSAGGIQEVEMTVNGQDEIVKSCEKLEASRASKLYGSVYIEANTRDDKYYEYLTEIRTGDWAEYRYLQFNNEKKFSVEAASWTYGGQLELHIDNPDGPVIGVVEIPFTDGWNKYKVCSCSIQPVQGKQALYFVFKGDTNRLFNIADFWFE